MPQTPVLSPTDAALLVALENDARMSFNDLAQEVGLSKTPCWARVRELERRKVITAYRAQIDPAHVGLELHAFVQVTITATRHTDFENAVLKHRSVLECYTTAGQADYMLHVLVAGIQALDELLRHEISRMPGVQRLVTTVGMRTIKQRGSIMECGGFG
jgi:Lrp/AsnC family transcriptional regulator, leucine-responsive regulatory protein